MDDEFNFSFSGLKTAVMRQVRKLDRGRLPVNDLAASFQEAVVDVLVAKSAGAASACGATSVHLVGGVSANSVLRQRMSEQLAIPVRYPPPQLCTDNAAMIAAAAHWHFIAGRRDGLEVDVEPGLPLTSVG
jgi:N6-L-threonylcarbamoyladenine synthase